MAEENKTIDEKSLSSEFQQLSQLPTENITDKDKESAEAIFKQIAESVKAGHQVTIAEYNIISRIHKVYDFNTLMNKLEETTKKTFATELNSAGNRKQQQNAVNQFCQRTKGSNKTLKTTLETKVKNLNTVLAKTKTKLTQEQIEQIQSFTTSFSEVTKKDIPTMLQTVSQGKTKDGKALYPEFQEALTQVFPKEEVSAENTPLNTENIADEQTTETLNDVAVANQLSDILQSVVKHIEEREAKNNPQPAPENSAEEQTAEQTPVQEQSAEQTPVQEQSADDLFKQLNPSEEIILNGFIHSDLYQNMSDEQRNELLKIGTEVEEIRNTPDAQTNLAEQFADKLLASELFSEEEKDEIFNFAIKAQHIENAKELNDLMSKGHENWDENDIARIQTLAKANINFVEGLSPADVASKLAEHQAWLDSQAQSPAPETTTQQTEEEQTADTPAEENTNEEQTEEEQTTDTPADENTNEEQNQEEQTPPEPEQEPITVNNEEITEYLTELYASQTEENYLQTLDPKISMTAVEAALGLEETPGRYATIIDETTGEEKVIHDEDGKPAMTLQEPVTAVENRAVALINPDDMLAALNLLETQYTGDDKEEKITRLKEVITHNLNKYEPSDITPESAFVLATLATKIKGENDNLGDDSTYGKITRNIAVAQKTYDLEMFGERKENETKEQQAARLEANYNAGLAALEDLPAEKTDAMLNGYTFTDDNGKPLKDKDRGLLNPLRYTSGKGNELTNIKEDVISAARLMVAQDLAKEGLPKTIRDADGNVVKTTEQILMEKMQEKIDQIMLPADDGKGGYSKSNIAGRLGGAMARGPETFKTRINQKFKNTSFYQTVHGKWEALDSKFEKKFGKPYIMGKKIAKMAAKLAPGIFKNTALFTAAGLVPGGVPVLLAYNAVKQGKQIWKEMKDPNITTAEKIAKVCGAAVTTTLSVAGVASPGLMEAFSNTLGNVGLIAARSGVVTAAITAPNLIKKAVLNRKEKAIKKKLAAEKDPVKIQELIKEQKKLQVEKSENNNKLLQKGIGVALGVATSQTVNAATGVTNSIRNFFSGNDDASNAQTPDAPEAKPQPASENAQPQSTAATENAAPDDLHGAKAPEGLTDEQKAQNLAAAGEKGSGHIGKSDMDSMAKDLNSHHGDKLGYTPEEKVSLMKAMAEGYGKESYEAVHAAMAEPYALADQMGITAEVEASAKAAGINTATDYSKAVLNHLATHPELAANDGFKAYVAEHFDAQDRFHSDNYSVHTQSHTSAQTPMSQQTAEEPVSHQPVSQQTAEEPVSHQPVSQQLASHQPTNQYQTQNMYENQDMPNIPPEGILANKDYAYVDGQHYHRDEEFSYKLGYKLNDRAIVGVYHNTQHPDDYVMITAPMNGYGQIIPDGRLTAEHYSYENLRNAQEQGHTGYENQTHKRQNDGAWNSSDYKIYSGSGYISPYNLPGNSSYADLAKASIDIAANIAHTAGDITDIAGGRGETLHRVGGGLSSAAHITRDLGLLAQVIGKNHSNG